MTYKCIDHNRAGRGPGYAQATINGITTEIHRHVYANSVGVSVLALTGKVVMHTCDNPRCINPAHLKLGTQADNMQDMREKKRSLAGTKNHQTKLTEEAVKEIKMQWASGKFSMKQLGVLHGCSSSQVHRIVHNQSWKA